MGKTINHEVLTDTITLTECTDGFWLYDKTRGMNLSMRAKTSQAAFIEALTYYQKRLTRLEKCHSEMKAKVSAFVESFTDEDD